MQKIHFDKRSIFVMSILGNIARPVVIAPINATTISQKRKNISTLHKEIVNKLIQKGLEPEAAEKKVKKLLANVDNEVINKLYYLQEHPDLLLSIDQLHKILAQQALFEQAIDFEDHISLAGLLQSVRGRPLSQKEVQALRDITMSTRLAS